MLTLWGALLLSMGVAQAQPYTGAIPRATTPTTWARKPNAVCGAGSTQLGFNTFTFSTLSASNVTITATRTSGSGTFSIDIYQRPFTPDPSWECVNWWGVSNSTTGNSVSATASCGAACNTAQGGTPLVAVISGASASEVSISTSGGGITRHCYLPSGLDQTTRSAPAGGGTYSGTYSTGDEIGCGTAGAWTSSNVPSWVTGIPASGSATTTFSYTVAANTGGARSATITIGTSTLTINQAAGCSYSLGASSASPAGSGGAGSVTVSAASGCAWTASTSTPWISGVTASGSGSGSVSYTVAANTGAARSGSITIAGQTFTVNQAAGCTVSVSPTSVSPSAAGGAASFTVTAGTGCAWTASTSSGFVSGLTASGTGSGTVSYTLDASTGPARTASIVVTATASGNSSTFSVNQASGCSYALGSPSSSAAVSAGSGSFTLTTGAGCPWTTSESATWLSGVTASGTGSGTISYSYAANTDASRSADITVAGLTHTVSQASGCTVSFSPASAAPSASGGSTTFRVTTGAGCVWSTSVSGSILSGVTAGGTGTGDVSYSVAANSGPARSGGIGVTAVDTGSSGSFTVNQASGCAYALTSTASNFGAGGGAGSFNVATSAGCPWSASSGASWLSGVTASGTGPGSVSFSGAANLGPARSALISLNGQTHTVSQASGCAIALSPASAAPASTGGTASFNVATEPGCTWTAATSDPFLGAVTAAGTGAGSVSYTVAANTGLVRSGAITVTATDTLSADTFSVTQGDGCVYSLTSASSGAAAGGGTGSFTLTTNDAACPWTATSNAAWIQGVTASGTGSGSIVYQLDENLGPARSATIRAGDQTFTVNQASGCVASLSASAASAAVGGGTESFSLTLSAPTCPWTASSSAGWLSGITPSGSGSATLSYTVAPNEGVARSATIEVDGRSFRVDQPSGCAITLPVDAASALPAGGASSFGVSSGPGCTFTASASVPWLSVSVGAGSVDYSVDPSGGALRTGSITVRSTSTDAEQTFVVSQADGCLVVLGASGATLDASGEDARIDVTSGPDCTWTAASDDPWVSGLTVDASGVRYSVPAYDGPERITRIRITSPGSGDSAEFAVTQRSGCSATLGGSPVVAPAGGATSVTASAAPGCTLEVSGGASWLTNVRLEQGSLRFEVAENTGVSRTQNLTVRSPESDASVTLVVTQEAGCTLVLPETVASFPESGAASELAVSSGEGCTWSATSRDAWVRDLASTASGVTFTVDLNDGVARSTLITIASEQTSSRASFAVDQNGPIVEPTITAQPEGASVTEGESFTLAVSAAGGGLGYQWFRDGQAIPGASGMSYGAPSATLDDAGDYYVVVTNGAGEVTSGLVRVEVEPAPLPDAGVATGDAGASTGDAGASADDAGRTDLDGGAAADDAAADPEAETVANGYGVSASGGACSLARTGGGDAQGFALVLLALGLLVRRRRARR